MTGRTPIPRYPSAMIVMHWLTFVLVVLAYVFMEFHEIFERGSAAREFMMAAHYSLGLTVLGLTLARLVVKMRSAPAPAIDPPPPAWQLAAAKMVHAAIYVFLLAMPLLGWATLSAEGDPVIFFGLQIPGLVEPSKILSGRLEEFHEIGATLGYVLIGGHALLAILHHAVFKDTTLIRIMPQKSA